MRIILPIFFIVFYLPVFSQTTILSGKVMNAKREPLAFASVQIKELQKGMVTKEDGLYLFELDEGKYDLIITMMGYKTEIITVIITKENSIKNIILETATVADLSEVTVKARNKDKAEIYITNVIKNKDAIENAAGNYSCKVYIKATQQDSTKIKKNKKTIYSDSMLNELKKTAAFNQMAMAEVVVQVDKGQGKNIKEQTTGISKRGNIENLFFLTTTQANINLYNNLLTIPAISPTTFISPISYSGLIAYKFKTIKIETINQKKYYTISIKPRQLSNSTVEGELTIADSSWTITHAKISFPKQHLADYDFFEVEQHFNFVNGSAWMMIRQQFIYNAASGKKKSSGTTVATYNNFELKKIFGKKYFGNELGSTTQEAYERDSSFWQENRTEPLTEKEVKYIHYKDSVYSATHTKIYLDSIDKKTNTITWQNVLYKGQNFNNHTKQTYWYLPALPSFFQPFAFGGARIEPSFYFSKTYASKKNIVVNTQISYGLRNNDVNGFAQFKKLYNPLHRSNYYIKLQKDFEFIFSGDAWINMISKNNLYLNQAVGIGHSFEIANGLYLFTDAEIAFRRSLSGYKTNNKVDSLLNGYVSNNRAVAFEPYNALYGKLRIEYTPNQRFLKTPKEKIILGSAYPTFYALLTKGVSGIFKSTVDFDYAELGVKQSAKLGTLGILSYTIKTGSFLNTKDLRLVDYKRQRRGDPIFFSNPSETFQSLDSSFALFKQFYEAHFLHEFNGALINKIPFVKKLGLKEAAGIGFLLAPERNNLRYGELYAGLERPFKFPFNQLGKFKLGVYVCASVANQFKNPVQFKFALTTWDKKNGRWF
jgi:Family of unknown function (DUF5686)/CarboxypepD_reg-like domain